MPTQSMIILFGTILHPVPPWISITYILIDSIMVIIIKQNILILIVVIFHTFLSSVLIKIKAQSVFGATILGIKVMSVSHQKIKKLPDKTAEINAITYQNISLKSVQLFSENLTALIDTGSQKTLLKKSVFA